MRAWRRNILGICPRSGTCPGSSPSFSSLLPGKARAHRTIVFRTGSSTFRILPPETRINDRNSEKAGYRTLVLYIFFPFLSFFIFSRLPFPLFVNFFFLFLPLPPLTCLHISPTLTLNQWLLIIVCQKRGPVAALTPTHTRDQGPLRHLWCTPVDENLDQLLHTGKRTLGIILNLPKMLLLSALNVTNRLCNLLQGIDRSTSFRLRRRQAGNPR